MSGTRGGQTRRLSTLEKAERAGDKIVNVRIPKERVEQLAVIARAHQRSVSGQIRWLVNECIEREAA